MAQDNYYLASTVFFKENMTINNTEVISQAYLGQ